MHLLTIVLITFILLTGCSKKGFTLQSLVDQYTNSDTNTSQDNIKEEKVKKRNDSNESSHFTLQNVYNTMSKDCQNKDTKKESNVKRMNKLPVIGKLK